MEEWHLGGKVQLEKIIEFNPYFLGQYWRVQRVLSSSRAIAPAGIVDLSQALLVFALVLLLDIRRYFGSFGCRTRIRCWVCTISVALRASFTSGVYPRIYT